jgi:hypothetical protein
MYNFVPVTEHLHIQYNENYCILIGNLALTLSAQLSFQSVEEFGLCHNMARARILKHFEMTAQLKV